ncbi:hypothetical protein B0J17DRAFT_657779 [Rhizoctonia solani]|nr:hypothetical protein B0J17DRAFT_657779 [Rhizoctonia solani]
MRPISPFTYGYGVSFPVPPPFHDYRQDWPPDPRVPLASRCPRLPSGRHAPDPPSHLVSDDCTLVLYAFIYLLFRIYTLRICRDPQA